METLTESFFALVGALERMLLLLIMLTGNAYFDE
jgi:hypothetical protein